MKPGSSDRCKVKNGILRCHLHTGHVGPHTAPRGNETVRWSVVTKQAAS